MDGRERRIFPRRQLQEEFYCYIGEGERLDAVSADISAGGIFLQTSDEIQIGTPVAIVFKGTTCGGYPVYLTGEAVRQEEGPSRQGIGVRWEKAVTYGSEDQLLCFLEQTLTIKDPSFGQFLLPEIPGGRVMYEFPHLVASSASVLAELDEIEDDDTAELSVERPTPVAQPKRAPVSRANKPRLSELPAFRHLAEPAKPVYRRTPEDGALTREVMAGEARTPADVKASLTVGSHTLKVDIISLGLNSLFVLTPYSPGKTGDRATVEFELRVRGGMADITCKCDVLAVDDGHRTRTPGFELRINRLNEGRNKGVLHDYVRWLTFRNIAVRE